MDQLVRFLRVKPAEGPQIVNQLRDTGCVEIKKLVAGDEPWLWLNSRGARQANTELAAMKPAINRLAHTRAINEARIFVEQTPTADWISERVLKPGYPKGAKIPDGVVQISGEHHAVEVELTAKSEARLRRIIAEHSARYDAVVYFCSPSALRKSWACLRGSARGKRTRSSSFEPCPIGRPPRPNRRRKLPPCIRGEESQGRTTFRSLT